MTPRCIDAHGRAVEIAQQERTENHERKAGSMADSTLTPRGSPVDEPQPPVEVRLSSSEAPGFAAVVRLCGEHDLATAGDVQQALDPIYGSVLVDLTDCEFLDSTVIGVLLRDSHSRLREGQRLELLVPKVNSAITRTLMVTGLRDLIPVHSRPPADHGLSGDL